MCCIEHQIPYATLSWEMYVQVPVATYTVFADPIRVDVRYKFHAAQSADPRGQMIIGGTLYHFPELNGHYVRSKLPFLKEGVIKARTPSPYSGS